MRARMKRDQDEMNEQVLVTYTSKHGATAEIVGKVLRQALSRC